MDKPQVELLAPAGSLTILKAVAAAGADAVYGAGTRFGARAYANNFTEEELLYAIDYLHLHGKRLYLTVNTLMKQEELSRELYDYILPLYRQGLDGVIVQDLGVLSFLREHFPGLELHASTQMSITGPHGAALMKKLGCCRVVTARELSLAEIREIHDRVDIEIESFIHGALCYCYSGQCLLSSMLGGRSGNRGRCAQPCRLPYRTKEAGEGYLLSPKDLCTIELLPEIIKSGVYSLKIEGRMKQAEYAAGVTAIYREYLDRCLDESGEEYRVAPEDLRRLMELGSRSGFTRGYYLQQNGPEMMAMEQPSHTKANEALQNEMRERYLQQEIQEKMNGILILSKENPARLVLQCRGVEAEVSGETVLPARTRPLDRDTVLEKMRKTGGSGFVFEQLELQMEADSFLPVGALNQLRRDGIEALRERLLSEFRRETADESCGDQTPGAGETIGAAPVVGAGEASGAAPMPGVGEATGAAPAQKKAGSPYLAVGVQTLEQCEAVLESPYADRIYVDSGTFDRAGEPKQLAGLVKMVHSAGKELYYVLPPVMRGGTICWYEKHLRELEESGLDGFVTGSYEGLGLLAHAPRNQKPVLADSSLYAWNARAARELLAAGADELTLPVELNYRELLHREYPGGELLLYGYLPLMVSAQCLSKNTAGCTKKPGFIRLKDRYGKEFPVKNQCLDCYNILYNSSPLSLLHRREEVEKLEASGYRIFFTVESGAQIREVLSYFARAFAEGEKIHMDRYLKDYTNGHFKRGAE